MEINEKLIKHIASIARLKLTSKEINTFKKDFKDILNAFSKIKEINTDKTKPSFQPVKIEPQLREDVPKPCLAVDEVLSLSSHKKNNYFKGPKVIE